MKVNEYFFYNEKIEKTGKPVITADNRSFRYGDGFFETIRFMNGEIMLKQYHFERLFSSLHKLKFNQPKFFTAEFLEQKILQLVKKNRHEKSARIRITIFGGDKGLYEEEDRILNYIIQSWQLDANVFSLNENGVITDIYKDARKTCDAFSHIKTNNYLPYAMAAIWAKENKLNEAFILNNFDRVCDATIANIFIVKNGKIKTPSLSEGCINGVMRRHMINCLQKENIPFEEGLIEADELFEANELFVTNAIRGVRWARQCGKSNYSNQLSKYLYEKFIKQH